MTLTTGGFGTTVAVGNREDLSDEIYMISPEDTPFMSAVGRGKASAVFHEWQQDSLAAVDRTNWQLEGDDITPATSAPTVRVGNYCQISNKKWAITGTQEVVEKAGRSSEASYQKAKRGKELKIDIEAIALNTQGYSAGATNAVRKARGLESFLTTNTRRGSGGADATAATAAPTDATAGDMRTFTETLLIQLLQDMRVSGARAKLLMTGPVNRNRVSNFTGRGNFRHTSDNAEKIQGTASLYASDYGVLRVVDNLWQRERSVFALDPDYISIDYLRPIGSQDLARIGDSIRGFMLAEWTLKVDNEAAHGIVADVTTT
jgi:hypothetical protein